ncbi:enoyl-CoA hydratase/isomerase family protein [Alkalitalea saponilacus]|uniref:Methylglutaconyl-CoA hydratase n=1 Tax=Alkalitalea saponilacus TaxID=889453 RepID=A0A1T5HSY4_9BACT|nr:enoyl-CoA hydratase-related protein [Alkalitalea saponilacus]ASB47672.1 methylglutaconyl-CoA hydratase [Alkalitalea saponilacus]SKC23815.1 methylglutaconyl-CoA hydratase [Alkalitalea saponilacus]
MTLIKKFAENICYLELNRPDKRNALNRNMILELIAFLQDTAKSMQYKTLVLSGKDGFFSSGADLDWMRKATEQSYEENLEDARLFNQLYHELEKFPKPIIVRADKGAYGGAIGILACADITITSPDALFAFSEVGLGLVPATVAPYVVKKTGLATARYLLLSGIPFNGEDAYRFNMVQQIFPATHIAVKTRELAVKLARNSPEAVQQTKFLLNRLGDSLVSVDKNMQELCAELISKARISADGQEGVKAFFEKRKPNWNDKKF